MGDLRQKNITLHLLIDNIDQEILGVECLVFLSPTQANLDKLVSVLKRGYLDNINLNFLGYLKDSESSMAYLVEKLGAKASRIKKISQFHLNFVSLGRDLFSTALSLKLE